MKKLNHENVIKLIEVLDDPKGDSLYMGIFCGEIMLTIVIEYCKHGTVMDIGLDTRAKPYSHEEARNLFRDLILGIEYRISLFNIRVNMSARTRNCASRYQAG